MAVIKYKIHELAKDFNLKSKKIIDMLTPYSETEKKSQTSLTADELDIVFDQLTKEYSVENFDKFFAMEKPAAPETPAPAEEPAPAEKAPEEKAAQPEKKENAPVSAAKPDAKKPAPAPAKPAARPSDPKPFKKKEPKADAPVQARTKGERKTVNTRASGVELDKYNERYENMSSSSYAQRDRDGDQHKQKITQKSKQYNKRPEARSRKRETEAERLKRIAEERANRKLVVKIGEEVTVGDFAAMLKMTAAELIKKLFGYGVMAGINESIDFDTAAIVAEDLGVKVEREVVVTIEDRIIDNTEDTEENL